MTIKRRGVVSVLRSYLRNEAAGGILLIAAAVAAMVVANGPAADDYFAALDATFGALSVRHWINDGLMALFFLLVGLEIKREWLDGHLSSWSDRRLPIAAAAGGMIVPALVYLVFAGGSAATARGWAVPAATDIAFAIGVLALLGSRVPASLKLFLTTVAIVDDMGAIAIIALVYTDGLELAALTAAMAILLLMVGINRRGVVLLWPYVILTGALWVAVLMSGIHATIAGVLAAMVIPLRRSGGTPDSDRSPLHRLEHGLHPWVAFGIVPLFGFANAGVSLGGVGLPQMLSPVPLGVAAGLFLGKQIGIFASVRLAVRFGIGRKPRGATWLQIYGIALICGIGFTMSLFIGGLAFADPARIDEVKIGVLGGSFLSALAGYTLLRFAPRRAPARAAPDEETVFSR